MGEEVALVTHDFNPCTHEVKPYHRVIPSDFPASPKKQVVLVDTPGFFGGDLAISDLDILNQISDWLRPKNG